MHLGLGTCLAEHGLNQQNALVQPDQSPSAQKTLKGKSAADASNFDEFPAEKLPTPEDVTCMDPAPELSFFGFLARAANIGSIIITYAILGVPYYNCDIIYPKTLF